MAARLAPLLFSLDPGVRYVAVNQGGEIREMEQRAGVPHEDGHVSVGVRLGADVEAIAERVGVTRASSNAGTIEQALRLALPRGFQ